MTSGNEVKLLLGFALPMFIGNTFQQFYNMADSIIVGRYIGSNALGAVGSVGNLTFLFFSLCMGLGSGIGILIAQFFGAGKDYSVKSGYQITHAIDVSKWNNQNTDGAIDWNQVKKDGIESVIIRCAYRGYGDAGTLSDDPYFKENICSVYLDNNLIL